LISPTWVKVFKQEKNRYLKLRNHRRIRGKTPDAGGMIATPFFSGIKRGRRQTTITP